MRHGITSNISTIRNKMPGYTCDSIDDAIAFVNKTVDALEDLRKANEKLRALLDEATESWEAEIEEKDSEINDLKKQVAEFERHAVWGG